MKLKLVQRYDYKNEAGAEVEILNIKRDRIFASGFGVLAVLNGRDGKDKPTWLTIDWVVPQNEDKPKKRTKK